MIRCLSLIAIVSAAFAPTCLKAQDGTPAGRSGLLGKQYVRASYVWYGVDNATVAPADDTFQGFDFEINTPMPLLSSEWLGSDFFAEYERQTLSGTNPANGMNIEADVDYIQLGTRLFAFPQSGIRPYVALGIGFVRDETRVAVGTTVISSDTDLESQFLTNLGVEFDIADRAALRADFELDREDLDESTFEGVLIVWPQDRVFLRGGVTVPLADGFEPGATIGGGLTY